MLPDAARTLSRCVAYLADSAPHPVRCVGHPARTIQGCSRPAPGIAEIVNFGATTRGQIPYGLPMTDEAYLTPRTGRHRANLRENAENRRGSGAGTRVTPPAAPCRWRGSGRASDGETPVRRAGRVAVPGVAGTVVAGFRQRPAACRGAAAPPEVPVTAGVVAARNVPQFLQGIGTVQAYNTVTVKTRVDGADRQGRLHRGPGGPARATCCSRSTRAPTRRPWRRRWPPRRRTRPSSRQRRPTWCATAGWSAPASRPGRAMTTSKAWWRSSRPRSRATRRRSTPRGSTSATPTSARRSTAALGARLVDIGNLRAGHRQHVAGDDHPDSSRSSSASRCRRTTLDADPPATAAGAAGRRPRWRADGKTELGDGQAQPDRQHDRPGHRHDPSEGDLPQPG